MNGRAGPVPPLDQVRDPVELVVTGMTCASCAARIERRLKLLDGVEASVNYATERAYVRASVGHDIGEIIGAIEAAGYGAATIAAEKPPGDQAARNLAIRLVLCTPPALTVIALSMVPQIQFPGWQWTCLALTIPVATWGAWPLHAAAWRGMRHAAASMDTLVSLGISSSFAWSLQAMLFAGAWRMDMRMPFAFTFGPVGPMTIYFDVTAGVTISVLTGRYLEARAKRHSASALGALAKLAATSASVLRGGLEHREPADTLAVGDRFVTRPGEKIAADGTVITGGSAVDISMLTGESMPVEVAPGDQVTGGTVNMSGRLVIEATRVGRDTQLAQIIRLVTDAQATKSRAQRQADRVAGVFVPSVIAAAVATLGFWMGAGMQSSSAWSAAFAVLVVACPCAMGLATSTALLAGVGRGAQIGILVRGATALESANRISIVALDKTGTVTTGVMSLTRVAAAPGTTEDEATALAGGVEDASEHPLGQAIARAASARIGELPPVTGFTAMAGSGVAGTVAGRHIVVGSSRLMAERSLEVPAELASEAGAAEQAGQTAVLLGWEGAVRAVLCVADAVRPTSASAVRQLRKLGLRPVLVTGDNLATALVVAKQVGIPAIDVFAEVTPEGKVQVIRDIQSAGAAVALVGDGVNDAAALAQADLGIAMGRGSDAAIGAADLTLTGSDLIAVAHGIKLARATLRTIRQNLIWAFGYNVIALPLAALGYLNPLFAGLAMAGSSLIVVGNGLRLRRFAPVAADASMQPRIGHRRLTPVTGGEFG